MANPDRTLDKTHLSIDQAEQRGFIHRDYIAHCLRWSHVCKHLHQGNRYKSVKLLDVGCGKEVPLAKLMYSSRLIPAAKGACYVGVDANKLAMPEMFAATGKFPLHLYGQTAFPAGLDEIKHKHAPKGFDVVTCFEVAEHLEPKRTLELLVGIKGALSKNGMAFLSTPCYDPKVGAAQNHINEMSFDAFGAMLQAAGLSIKAVYGTFASQKDYKAELHKNGPLASIFEQLSAYYDSNYLATVFAPLYPHLSRNCIWVVDTTGRKSMFKRMRDVEGAEHSSSPKWAAFVKGYK